MSLLFVFLVHVNQYTIQIVFLEHIVELGELEGVGVVGVELVEDALQLDAAYFVLRLVEVVGLYRVLVPQKPFVHTAAVIVGSHRRRLELWQLIRNPVLDLL